MQVYRTDPLSKQICERCCIQLENVAKFKKNSQDTAERHKENLKSNNDQENTDVQLFLGCDVDMVSIHYANATRLFLLFN